MRRGNERAREALALGDEALLLSDADVSDFSAMEALRDEVRARFGDVAVLMNNAGVGGGGGPSSASRDGSACWA